MNYYNCGIMGESAFHFDITSISITFSNNGFPPNISISLRASISFLLRNSRTYSKVPVLAIISSAYCFTSTDVGFWLTILRSCRLDESSRIAWMIGNENLPSVKSSQNPLFFVYYKMNTSVHCILQLLPSHLLYQIVNSCNRRVLENGCQ